MIAVTAASAYFDGPCADCDPDEQERGGAVTQIEVGGVRFSLCPSHTNVLIDRLQRAGVKREI